MVILGISLGTRTSGIAIISKGVLIEWRTLSFKNSWSEQKADYILRTYERYVSRNKVTVVSIKIPPASHFTASLKIILERLFAMLTYHGCTIEYMTKQQLKQVMPHVRNTNQLMQYTASLYPVIAPSIAKEFENRNKYHHKMAEAVIVAHYSQYREHTPSD